MVIDPQNPQRVYVAAASGVVRSDDAGQTWAAANAGIGEEKVAVLALNPASPDTIYAVTTGGVLFMSGDAAATWQQVGS